MITNVDYKRIKQIRLDKNLSQKEIAKYLNDNSVYPYHRKENGKQKFTADDIFLISELFKKPLKYFFCTQSCIKCNKERGKYNHDTNSRVTCKH